MAGTNAGRNFKVVEQIVGRSPSFVRTAMPSAAETRQSTKRNSQRTSADRTICREISASSPGSSYDSAAELIDVRLLKFLWNIKKGGPPFPVDVKVEEDDHV